MGYRSPLNSFLTSQGIYTNRFSLKMIIYWTSLYYAFHMLKTVQEYVVDSQKIKT